MPSKYVDGVYPIYLETGRGAYVADSEGNQFLDYPMGLGAILLGYAYPSVNEAVKTRIDLGTLFTFPSYWETVLAKKLTEIIPSFEQVRFLKTGSEATAAAVKIARSYTKKEHIAFCGYHGWHDWYTVNTPKNKGIPECYKDLTHKFEYNNIESLRNILKSQDVAAVILEPCIFEEPKDDFLDEVRTLTHMYGALLIFDEVVTGFRFPGLSYQKYIDVIPDLTTLGKAMGNGFPISCVGGKRRYMQELEGDCFVSSTYGGDLIGIIAALETIRVLEHSSVDSVGVLDKIEFLGSYLRDGYNEIALSLGIDTKAMGYPNRTMHVFPSAEHKSLFWQECIKRGVIFGYATFICASHTQQDIDYSLEVIKDALEVVKKNWSNPRKALNGKVATEVFRLTATR